MAAAIAKAMYDKPPFEKMDGFSGITERVGYAIETLKPLNPDRTADIEAVLEAVPGQLVAGCVGNVRATLAERLEARLTLPLLQAAYRFVLSMSRVILNSHETRNGLVTAG